MKRKIKLSESDLYRIINRVMREQNDKGEKDIDMDDEDIDDEDIDDEDIAKYSDDEIEDKKEECRELVDMLKPLLEDLESMCDSDEIFELLPTKVAEIEDVCDSLNNFIDGIESNAIGL